MLSSLPIIAGILSATFITAFGAPAASIDLVSNLVFPTAAYQDPNDEFLVVAEKVSSFFHRTLFAWIHVSTVKVNLFHQLSVAHYCRLALLSSFPRITLASLF